MKGGGGGGWGCTRRDEQYLEIALKIVVIFKRIAPAACIHAVVYVVFESVTETC